jgi:DNA-binding NarL/FixJ family response regulator
MARSSSETLSLQERGAPEGASFRVEKSVVIRTATPEEVCDDPIVASIVIVDDDPRFRGIARRLLESEGFEVVGEAADGREAISVSRELDPDIVLLDVQLPDIDGIQVAAQIVAGGARPAVVLTSTRDESDFGPELQKSGARGFVPKDEISAERITSLCE